MAIDSKPDEIPEFALLDQNDPVTGEANVAEPPTAKKNYGWAYLEKPGHNWFNWLHRKTSEWLTYFNQFFSATHQFLINEIVEYDADAGVTIDGSLIKDGDIKVDTISEKTADAGVTIDGSLIKDGDIKVDTISEKTADAGVTIDGVELKDNDITTSGGIATGGNSTKLAWKVIEIGDWNMDILATHSVAHGLGGNWSNVRSISIIIRHDNGTIHFSSEGTLGGVSSTYITNTSIIMAREAGGSFDSTDFDSTSYNRGWITIAYEV